MRGRLIIAALLALALHGCGSGDSSTSKNSAGASQVAVSGTTVAAGKGAATTDAESAAGQVQAAVEAKPVKPTTTFVAAKKRGRAPAVVFVHDLASGRGQALSEAHRLAKKGVASLVITGEHAPSGDAAQFAAAVDRVEGAIRRLRRRSDVDPNRIALVGEGNGARVAAVVLGGEHGRLRGAVLADLGVAGGGAGRYAPERWLARARGSLVMLQRSTARDRTTDEQIKQLLLAAPPGTLVYDYRELDGAAQAARDRWLRRVLA